MTFFAVWVFLAVTTSLVIVRGIRIADEALETMPARLDPRAGQFGARLAQVAAWSLVLTVIAAGVLYAGSVDFEAAGGTR